MITIQIGKKKYKGIYSWREITLLQYSDLASIPMPEGYEDFILADAKFSIDNMVPYIEAVSNITDTQLNEEFPAYYRKVIGKLTNIPDKAKLSKEVIEQIYECYCKPFVVSLIYHIPVVHFMGQTERYTPEMIPRVRIGLRYYYLPDTVRIMDQDIPLAKEPMITHTEASDVFAGMKMSKEDIDRLALFMAIYLRRKNIFGRREKYNEWKMLRRKERMLRLPMSVVWSVFFYTVQRISDYSHISQLFGGLRKTSREVVRQARTYRNTGGEGLFTKQPTIAE